MSPQPLLLACLIALIPATAAAAPKWEKKCSVKLPKDAPAETLKAKATVSKEDAETIARANMTRRPGPLKEGVLEVDSGCLVWSLTYKRGDKPGYLKLLVDAGDGQLLVEKSEAPSKEELEKAKKKH